ncbi:hypothetical protein GCM10011609_06420 [Lentzea pudingi]|uniref:Uncharacterized protein n=1 Tax=Lentzea pudingi TaxID=1789439 RepID=A0ABQ2HBQ9_9PSEU|nr:hypothetical protein GCM10011609_06420 [Lentzea pudingi]
MIGASEQASSSTAHGPGRCSNAISTGETASAVTRTVALVIRPSVTSGPRSCSGARATRRAITVCKPIAGTAPIARSASSEPISPKTGGASSRAAITVSR